MLPRRRSCWLALLWRLRCFLNNLQQEFLYPGNKNSLVGTLFELTKVSMKLGRYFKMGLEVHVPMANGNFQILENIPTVHRGVTAGTILAFQK